jgi:hypothetical protein
VLRDFVVFGFATTHDALIAEGVLLDAGLEVAPIPTPAALGFKCGLALRLPVAQAAPARSVLNKGGLAPTAEASIQDI